MRGLRVVDGSLSGEPSRGSASRRSCAGAGGSCSAATRRPEASTGCCPGGGVNSGESLVDALHRELAEEVGIERRAAGRGPGGDRRLDRARAQLRGQARRAHHLRGRSRAAGRSRRSPRSDAAVRGHRLFDARRARRDRPAPADPALPARAGGRATRSCTSARSGRPRRHSRHAAVRTRRASRPVRAPRETRVRPRGLRARPARVVVELRRLAAGPVRERLREQPVGEPRVAREQRPVQVRADARGRRGSPRSRSRRRCRSPATTRPSGSAPSSRHVRPAWFSKPASVRGSPGSSSHSSRTSPIIRRSPATVSSGKSPTPGSSAPLAVAVEAAEQLVPAADGQQAAAPPATASLSAVALRREVRRDQRLLAVLAAADVEEVVLAGRRGSSERRSAARRARCPAPGGAPLESTAMLPRSA